MRLLFASTNTGKIREIKALLPDIEIVTPGEMNVCVEAEEAGETFLENAMIKACAYADASGLPTLADDSGLVVDALGGQPGVRSARVAATDSARIEWLLEKLKDVPEEERSARFVCVCVLAKQSGEVNFASGTCEGKIMAEKKGCGGFGYDPVFFVNECGKTMAELDESEKNMVSHRARAVAEIKKFI